jgi:hypothetical protein
MLQSTMLLPHKRCTLERAYLCSEKDLSNLLFHPPTTANHQLGFARAGLKNADSESYADYGIYEIDQYDSKGALLWGARAEQVAASCCTP